MNDLERAKPLLLKALYYSGGTHSWDDVVNALIAGHMQLWVNEEGAAITEILAFPQKKVLHVFLAGGKMSAIISMLEDAKDWGKAQKCVSMTISGRKGWEKVLPKEGFTANKVIMEKEF